MLRLLGSALCLLALGRLHAQTLTQKPAEPVPSQPGQSQPAPDQPAFTLHASTRLVLTDVTVNDRNGNPVQNLPRSAFHVFDGNVPQEIASFEEHSAANAPADAPTAAGPLPKGVYNNDFILHPPPVLDVILLDITNLKLEDQMYLSYQLTQFLNTLPAGQQLAIYERQGTVAVLLQNFTSDRKLLLDAVHRGLPRLPPTGREYLSDLDTLQQIGTYLTGLPGRKNILWFSGGSTLFLRPDATPIDDSAVTRRIYDTLEANRIAIFPIDARGLVVIFGGQAALMTDQHGRMNDVADATGGHAFFNNNGFRQIADHITTDGSDFYTLTYSPRDYQEDKKWHKVRVTLDLPGYTLSYRRGYFADGINNAPQNEPRSLRRLIAGGATEDTSTSGGTGPIVFQARVLPSSDPDAVTPHALSGAAPLRSIHGGIPYSIHYTVPASDLTLSSSQGKAAFNVLVAAFVFSQQGTVINRSVEKFTLSVVVDKLRSHPNINIPFDQQLQFTKGQLYILLAVVDEGSGRSGNVQITLDVPAAEKQKK